jgi:hypothetical protein
MRNEESLGYIKLPNKCIWNYKNSEDTYVHLDYRIPYVLTYLDGNRGVYGDVKFTIEDMIISCDKTPKSGKGKTNEQFKNTLNIVVNDLKLMEINKEIEKVKPSELIIGYNLETFKNMERDYFLVDRNAICGIMNLETKIDIINILNVYFYIVSRLNRRLKLTDDDYDIRREGGKAICTFATQKQMMDDLNLSELTLIKTLQILKINKFIYYNNIGKIKKEEQIREANNVYALNTEELKEGLKESKYYWGSNGWKMA